MIAYYGRYSIKILIEDWDPISYFKSSLFGTHLLNLSFLLSIRIRLVSTCSDTENDCCVVFKQFTTNNLLIRCLQAAIFQGEVLTSDWRTTFRYYQFGFHFVSHPKLILTLCHLSRSGYVFVVVLYP